MARCTTVLAILAAIALPASAPGQDATGETPPGMESHSSYYGGAEGETVIQLHGAAPFEIILANGGD